MKTIIFILLLVTTVNHAFSQTDVKTKEYYLAKSHHQKTVAWIMLGGGAALTTIGIAISETNTVDYALGDYSNNNTAGIIVTVAGLASALGSIPLFISAAHNKKTALSLSAGLQELPTLHTAGTVTIAQPSIKIKLVL